MHESCDWTYFVEVYFKLSMGSRLETFENPRSNKWHLKLSKKNRCLQPFASHSHQIKRRSRLDLRLHAPASDKVAGDVPVWPGVEGEAGGDHGEAAVAAGEVHHGGAGLEEAQRGAQGALPGGPDTRPHRLQRPRGRQAEHTAGGPRRGGGGGRVCCQSCQETTHAATDCRGQRDEEECVVAAEEVQDA